jgi:predicted  nucleic acid-binding Zn-ribbon protein
MRTHAAPIVIILAAAVTLAQSPNWDGRRGGGSIEFPRMDRSSTSGNDSRRSNDSDRYDTYAIPEPPNPLPGLTNQYRAVRGWFRADVFPDAPAMVEPTNLSELFRALAYLKDFADGRLRTLRNRRGELEDRYRSLQAQIANNSDAGNTLQLETTAVESDLERSQRETREAEEKLAAQNSLLNQLTEVTKQLSESVAAAKNEMFASLYDATRRGLLSPANYRPLPKPLPPVYGQSSSQTLPTAIPPMLAQPLFAAGVAPAEALRAVPIFAPLSAQPIRRTPITEAEVQDKLNQINNSLPLINQAADALNDVYRRVKTIEQSASASETFVQQTRARLESLRSESSNAASALSSTRAKLVDATEAYQRQREKFPVQCLEYAVMKYYDKKVKDLVVKYFPNVKELVGKDSPDVKDGASLVDVKNLGRFMKVMSHVVELGSDTLKVIDRAPGALADTVEDPAALQAALDEAVERFKLNLFTDLSGVPKPIAKYFQKRSTP